MTAPVTATTTEEAVATRRVVHRIVLPTDSDPDTLPLYIDFEMARPGREDDSKEGPAAPVAKKVTAIQDTGVEVTGRRTLTMDKGARLSFASYFNAFPASYWRRWTDLTSVRLDVEVSGPATIVVYKSNARGESQRTALRAAAGGIESFDLPLAPFGDGGWYWFDLYATDGGVTLERAEWSVDSSYARQQGTVSAAITTFNRPDYCVAQMRTLGRDEGLKDVLDRIYVVDQGTQRVQDEDGYDEIAAELGDRLQLVRQGNLGGSGGFARGMREVASKGDSDYVLLLDDDVTSEPEGILRAVAFADFCRTPTLVGGHMFSMFLKSQLHTYGERVNRYRFFWGPVPGTEEAHDFGVSNLSATRWMHRRVDVDFNGWWMCLIPVETVRQIGLSLPVFIKWDDSEFGLRAQAAGFPTVSLPGAAVWHVPWTDKDDTIDWQAYYHQRNRWLVSLLYSPYRGGGSLPRESFAVDVKHLLSLQYSAVELRLKALEDLLEGPEHLHRTLGTMLAEVRVTRSQHPDAVISKDPAAYPETRRHRPPSRGRDPKAPSNIVGFGVSAATGALRQLRPVRPAALEIPEERVAAVAARWWRLSHLDSAVVTSADGTGASMYIRDPELFRSYLTRSIRLHRRASRQWKKLQAQYRDALPQFTAQSTWEDTFAANGVVDDDS
ncbi:glycosyltransferase [Demequina capsici]|uniref:Glycosyltransferase n=1 Tax=Demequina capsici TaxID=3075620 RepID=A0AA96JCQ8_9MICO|nr:MULTISPECIES: glycosyltransferase [unclassified Demequina]WNM24359.1 glycosyltransferase [Demequina sp. OYTSA14]WNM27181.1 glycosyltransferase [Demequina sp. PMTSA13]